MRSFFCNNFLSISRLYWYWPSRHNRYRYRLQKNDIGRSLIATFEYINFPLFLVILGMECLLGNVKTFMNTLHPNCEYEGITSACAECKNTRLGDKM